MRPDRPTRRGDSKRGPQRLPAVVAGTAAALAAALLLQVPPASADVTTIYAAPSGSGSACSQDQPCSLAAAQDAVRSANASMSADLAVQLADGVYRLPAPLRFTGADSGTNGHIVSWQAAPGAHPVISGAKQVTGWSPADAARNIWRADVGAGQEARQLYVNGTPAVRARTGVNRSDLTFTNTGMRFGNSALGYLNNLANQNRVELEAINSWTDRYSPVQSISGNVITMQQPAWNNNNFGYDVISSPFRAGPLYLENAYEFLDSPGEWYLNPASGVLSYIPRPGENLNTADVEFPVLQSLLAVGGSYASPAHHLSFSGITFTGTSWLGPSSSQGFADEQTGAYLQGNWSWPALTSCQSGCTQFEAARPHWSQMPAAVQVSAANTIGFSNDRFVNLGQNALGIGNDPNAHAGGVGLGTASVSVTRSTFLQVAAGAIVAGGVQADAHHPSDARMTNRDLTISNNLVHDIGFDYRDSVSFLPTYVTNALISHNEVYNMPYSGISVGYGWGSNDAGGVDDYANRGLYNYQPRYTTATTATNDQVTDNYVHDVMQQMNDGGCIYTLSANPNGRISGNYCLRTNNYYGLYFDEGSRYFTATNNVFSNIGTWSTANGGAGKTTGNLTVTNNWTTNGTTWIGNGNGNVVTGNVTVSNNNWPSGAQAVMANAGIQSGGTVTTTTTPGSTTTGTTTTTTSGGGQQNVMIVGAASGRCADVSGAGTTNGAQVQLWDCHGGSNQRWTTTAGRQLTVYGNKCLDASGQGSANGTNVVIWDCNGQPNQQWAVNPNGTVTSLQSGLCLDANGAGTANGTRLILWSCHGGTNQQWSLRS